jgi:hypothetical protein
MPTFTETTVGIAAPAPLARLPSLHEVRGLESRVGRRPPLGRLAVFLEAFEPKPAPIHLLHAARGQMPLKTRRFLDFAAPKLRHALDGLGGRP